MNRIKTYLGSFSRATRAIVLAVAVIFGVAGIAQATTITTSITTVGVTATGNATVGGTLGVTGLTTLLGGATTTQLTLLMGDTLTNTAASTTVLSGTLSLATTTTVGLNASGASTLASTTATSFKVGQLGAQMTRINAGYCVIASVSITANTLIQTGSSTPAYADCVPSDSASVTGSRVFVMATSSLPSYIRVHAASSSSAGINVELINTSTSTVVTAATYSFNYWAFQ